MMLQLAIALVLFGLGVGIPVGSLVGFYIARRCLGEALRSMAYQGRKP